MAQELLADRLTDLMIAYHVMDLLKGRPLDTVRLTGLQNYLNLGSIPVQTIMVIVGTAFRTGIQQFKFLRPGFNAGLFPQFPDNGRQAVLPCLGRTTGILPSSCKAFFRGSAGQQQVSFPIIYPHRV